VCDFLCFFVCTVTDFATSEKIRGVKFCMRVGLRSGQVFSIFGELWLVGSHGGDGICTGRRSRDGSGVFANCGKGRRALGLGAGKNVSEMTYFMSSGS